MSTNVVFNELGGPDVLTVVDTAVPSPAVSEVQIKVRAAGLNRVELLFFAGEYLFQPVFPSRVGVEASGVVSAVGDGVEGIAVGESVSVFPTINMSRYGVIGEYANVPSWAVIPKPE